MHQRRGEPGATHQAGKAPTLRQNGPSKTFEGAQTQREGADAAMATSSAMDLKGRKSPWQHIIPRRKESMLSRQRVLRKQARQRLGPHGWVGEGPPRDRESWRALLCPGAAEGAGGGWWWATQSFSAKGYPRRATEPSPTSGAKEATEARPTGPRLTWRYPQMNRRTLSLAMRVAWYRMPPGDLLPRCCTLWVALCCVAWSPSSLWPLPFKRDVGPGRPSRGGGRGLRTRF